MTKKLELFVKLNGISGRFCKINLHSINWWRDTSYAPLSRHSCRDSPLTTIAYSRAAGELAADTQCTNGTRKMRTRKVHTLKGGALFAGAGNLVHLTKVQRWATGGFKDDEQPDFGDESGDFECLIVYPDGSAKMVDEGLELLNFTDEFIALGSGSSYALAAMACGKTPAEAVEIAARYDCATSGPVEVFPVGKTKAKIKSPRKAR